MSRNKDWSWSPVPLGPTVASVVVIAAWVLVVPILNGFLGAAFDLPDRLALILYVIGEIVILAVIVGHRRSRGRPYREALASARSRHARAVVYAIRLDPVATPVGTAWSDSRDIRWGFISATARGIEIVRSDGTRMLDRQWGEVRLVAGYRPRLVVESLDPVEEWWIPFLTESGVWPFLTTRRFSAKRLERLRSREPS